MLELPIVSEAESNELVVVVIGPAETVGEFMTVVEVDTKGLGEPEDLSSWDVTPVEAEIVRPRLGSLLEMLLEFVEAMPADTVWDAGLVIDCMDVGSSIVVEVTGCSAVGADVSVKAGGTVDV